MKRVLLSVALPLALVSAQGSDPNPNDKLWFDDPIVVSEQTLNNVIVVSNPSPFQVIVSIDGNTDLRVVTTRPIPRRLTRSDRVKLKELLLRWPDTPKNRAEKKAGSYEKSQDLASQTGEYWEVPVGSITQLKPTSPQTPGQPKASAMPAPI